MHKCQKHGALGFVDFTGTMVDWGDEQSLDCLACICLCDLSQKVSLVVIQHCDVWFIGSPVSTAALRAEGLHFSCSQLLSAVISCDLPWPASVQLYAAPINGSVADRSTAWAAFLSDNRQNHKCRFLLTPVVRKEKGHAVDRSAALPLFGAVHS